MDTRWWILICCSIHSFCTDFFFESPSIVVQRLLGTADACTNNTDTCLSLDLYQFNLVFGLNSYFSALAALLAGVLIDRYGSKVALWCSAFLVFLGPLLFALGPYSSETGAFALLLLGRIIMGLGTGGGIVIMHRMKASWFLYRELALSFSVHIVSGRLGSTTAFLLLGAVVEPLGLRGCLWLAFGLNLLSVITAIALAYLDQRGSAMANTSPHDGSFLGIWGVIKRLDGMFWSCATMGFFFYGTIAMFTANGPNYLATNYGFSESTASYITGILYDIGLLAPLSGWLTDRFGYREHWFNGSTIGLFIGLLLLYLIKAAPPGLWIILMGIGYTAYAPTLWSSMPLIVPRDAVGLATGTGKFLQFLGVGTLSVAAGAILDMNSSKRMLPWDAFFTFLACTSGVCVLCALTIWYLNRAEHRLTPTQRERDQLNGMEEITPLNVDYGSGTAGFRVYDGTKSSTPSVKVPDEIQPRLTGNGSEKSL